MRREYGDDDDDEEEEEEQPGCANDDQNSRPSNEGILGVDGFTRKNAMEEDEYYSLTESRWVHRVFEEDYENIGDDDHVSDEASDEIEEDAASTSDNLWSW
ncbi:uncharacterized protein Z518_06992 [Rhinocladiella mackenziei CBS 650.93]|uniref:Uncharacterized protein n=1 Tax=Rhinocladiella mackenziei CBS 650.93 TaxID=1442369 RepID=A0A0D2J3B3_9EURO|nr:uncharacterized protein Z518_06992 [Rhinocladiella mackenziei CBS 650.93]KIX03440.1 hypothetical protein Z518_06992 [Rhinocladiella mackenziei CBS 650.93]